MAYPLLYGTTPQADPGLAHTTAISNVTELQAMTTTGNYYLTGNIDASITSTWNGGAGFTPITNFTGTFDGCGYTISNLFINRNSNQQGLFGKINANTAIANLTLENINYTGGGYWVGGLFALAEPGDAGDILIQNCHVSGNITSYGVYMGYYGGMFGEIRRIGGDSAGSAFVYDSSSSVCIDMGSATTYSYRGGFAGFVKYVVFRNCFATGSLINGQAGDACQCIGAFVGIVGNDCDFDFCYATGDVEGGGNGRLYGGFVGSASQDTTLNSCYATGNVSGEQEVGSFVGHAVGTSGPVTFTDCYAWGNAIAYNIGYAGGFCGAAEDPNIHFINCYSTGSASAATFEGGFIGSTHINITATACFWDKEASGNLTTSQNKGEGKITKWFRKQKHFTDVGWDFATIWYLPAVGQQIIMGRPRSSYPVQCPHTTHRNVYG